MKNNTTLDETTLRALLTERGLPGLKASVRLEGGGADVFRLDLEYGDPLVLKIFEGDGNSASIDAYAAGLLAGRDISVTRFVLVDETCTRLPFRFALTTHLPGLAMLSFATHRDYDGLFFEVGQLARKLHSLTLPKYGLLRGPAYATNVAYVRALAEHAFGQFLHYGADTELVGKLRCVFDRDFDTIVPASTQAVFAHDDLHPGNVIADETDNRLSISGVIDFGNARASCAVMDLAKTIFCCEHMSPGCGSAILDGYGPIDHSEPEAALDFYTMLHRIIMWWWLRHVGILPSAESDSDLIDALKATAEQA